MKRKRGETRRREGAGREGRGWEGAPQNPPCPQSIPGPRPSEDRPCPAGAARPGRDPRPPPAPRGGAAPARPRPPPPRGPAGPRLTRAVQEEPERQGRAEGCVCRPHPAPTGAHGPQAPVAPGLHRPARPPGSAGRAGQDTGSAPRRGQGGPACGGGSAGMWDSLHSPARVRVPLSRARHMPWTGVTRLLSSPAPPRLCCALRAGPAGPFPEECVFPEPFQRVLPALIPGCGAQGWANCSEPPLHRGRHCWAYRATEGAGREGSGSRCRSKAPRGGSRGAALR